jgi:hypothetical protein
MLEQTVEAKLSISPELSIQRSREARTTATTFTLFTRPLQRTKHDDVRGSPSANI